MIVETRQMTVEEYFAFDEASEIRIEFIDGEIYPMPGGTGSHNSIVANVIMSIGIALRERDCTVYASQMRVRIDASRYVYPDVSVVCSQPEYEEDSEVTLLNPAVVVEVTSPSSIATDHVEKVAYYGAVSSIQGYLILDQERVFAEWYTRTESGWHLQQFNDANDEIALEPLGCQLKLAQVYRGVSLSA